MALRKKNRISVSKNGIIIYNRCRQTKLQEITEFMQGEEQ
jgi:hypothetical protein